jgi:putative spermidine/putrescine transport system permease protein
MAALVEQAGGRPAGGGHRRLTWHWVGVVPFLAYTTVFLLIPTATVVFGAFSDPSTGVSFTHINELFSDVVWEAFKNSILVSGLSAAIGAIVGALLSYAIVTGPADSRFRRVVMSVSGVLAQFGGVTLAFAFIATLGEAGFVYIWLQEHGIDIYADGVWLYKLPGLVLVYAYFQIPLMVLVFTPSIDGMRRQWREATENLGGTAWDYWRLVGAPILAPAFLGSLLLLFANAFSAYATVYALINQGGIVLPIQIGNALSSEIGEASAGFAKALALLMVLVVAVVMSLYALLQRRAARWLR